MRTNHLQTKREKQYSRNGNPRKQANSCRDFVSRQRCLEAFASSYDENKQSKLDLPDTHANSILSRNLAFNLKTVFDIWQLIIMRIVWFLALSIKKSKLRKVEMLHFNAGGDTTANRKHKRAFVSQFKSRDNCAPFASSQS